MKNYLIKRSPFFTNFVFFPAERNITLSILRKEFVIRQEFYNPFLLI